jgi:hypothetical protein
MYNYGYRDYRAELGRFTTEDPVRDGVNWFAYTNSDPVNWIDPDGTIINAVFGAAAGFVSAAVGEVAGRMAQGQTLGEAAKNTFTSGTSWAVMGSSAVIGGLTSGLSTVATNIVTAGAKSVVSVAVKTVSVNIVAGAVDAAAKDVVTKAIQRDSQDVIDTLKAAGEGALWAAGSSVLIEAGIAMNSARAVNTVSSASGVFESGVRILQPEGAKAAGAWGETVLPVFADTLFDTNKQLSKGK